MSGTSCEQALVQLTSDGETPARTPPQAPSVDLRGSAAVIAWRWRPTFQRARAPAARSPSATRLRLERSWRSSKSNRPSAPLRGALKYSSRFSGWPAPGRFSNLPSAIASLIRFSAMRLNGMVTFSYSLAADESDEHGGRPSVRRRRHPPVHELGAAANAPRPPCAQARWKTKEPWLRSSPRNASSRLRCTV